MLNALFSALRRVQVVFSSVTGSVVAHPCGTSVTVRVESPSSRVQRVNAALHGNMLACDT